MVNKLNLTRLEKIELIKNYLDDESLSSLCNKTEEELEEQIDLNLTNILLAVDREQDLMSKEVKGGFY